MLHKIYKKSKRGNYQMKTKHEINVKTATSSEIIDKANEQKLCVYNLQ